MPGRIVNGVYMRMYAVVPVFETSQARLMISRDSEYALPRIYRFDTKKELRQPGAVLNGARYAEVYGLSYSTQAHDVVNAPLAFENVRSLLRRRVGTLVRGPRGGWKFVEGGQHA